MDDTKPRPAAATRILLTTLWERESARGNTYMSGLLGKAALLAFEGEPRPDGGKTWNLYVVPGKEPGK